MIYKDYLTLKNDVLREYDAESEDFYQPEEIKTFFNDAIREAVAHIQKLGLEDEYFQKSVTQSLITGQQDLLLPTDIYAAKIKGVIYSTPAEQYQIRRIKGAQKFQMIHEILQNPPANARYMYDLENPSPTAGFRMMLYPPSQETTPNCIVIYYIRDVVEIVNDTDLVDIPQFYSFIKAFVKYKLAVKENSDYLTTAKEEYEKETQLMLATLAEMTPDYDNLILGDFSHYNEHN